MQDAAAQLSINYLEPKDGELILDCCAAPGGKTAHILERTSGSEVVAIDCDDTRLKRVHENLKRLNLQAKWFAAMRVILKNGGKANNLIAFCWMLRVLQLA